MHMIMKSIIVVTLVAAAVARPNKNGRRDYANHLEQVFSFPCSEPQRRVVPLSEIMEQKQDMVYYPASTVLHRCDSMSGCCLKPGEQCSPKTSEEVELSFVVYDVSGKHFFESVKAVNHTSCGCKFENDVLK